MTFHKAAENAIERMLRVAKRSLGWSRTRKQLFAMSVDGLLCLAAIWLAFSTRLGVWIVDVGAMGKVAAGALPIWLIVFWKLGIYRAIFRYAGAGTMIRLAAGCMIMTVPMIGLYLVYGWHGVPRTVAVLQPAFFLILLAASRIFGRYVLMDLMNSRNHRGEAKRALIYGVGLTAQQLAASVRIEGGLSLLGFVSPDERMSGHTIDGVPVVAERALAETVDRQEITDIFLAFENESREERSQVVSRLGELSVHVQMLPPIRELVDKRVTVSSLREIQIADILGRDTVKPYPHLMQVYTKGQTVLVTGGGGSIGSELTRQITELCPGKLVIADSSEYNLYSIDQELRERLAVQGEAPFEVVSELVNCADRDAIARMMQRHKPNSVFHAAAYKHVPLLESNVVSCVRNNVLGTFYTVSAAIEAGVERFVLVSTDKAVRPTNVMGCSKRFGEVILQALAQARPERQCVLSMVRFGNVLGSSGSVVPQFQRQIKAGGPVTVTHRDMTRYFMTIPEASQLVMQAGAIAQGGEVFVLDMGDPVRIVDLARSMIRLAGQTERGPENPEGDIEIVEVGLRPGEKMFEELFIGATHRPTIHPQIMMAHENFIDWTELQPVLAEIEDLVRDGNSRALKATLEDVVRQTSDPILQDDGDARVTGRAEQASPNVVRLRSDR
jgi:FlaA1/EpsC-like NDP-sugar epimerase